MFQFEIVGDLERAWAHHLKTTGVDLYGEALLVDGVPVRKRCPGNHLEDLERKCV
jgi:hypothetical protein